MIIQLEKNLTNETKDNITQTLTKANYTVKEVKTQISNYLVAIGKKDIDIRILGNLKGVKDVHHVNANHKLVSKKWKVCPTIIDIGDEVAVGSNGLSIMAGPCSIENEEQIEKTADFLARNNIKIMRGGVFKPRSSPYAFRGVGIDGLKIFSSICKSKGIKIISEVMQKEQIEEMYDYIDIYQVGARNSQNFNLLDALGKVDKPVMIKRGLSGTIDELLYSAEYVFSGGNEKILLCERGIRTYEKAYRNTFDINAIPMLKEKSHLPVIADPSHGTGIRSLVPKIALSSVIAGADGIMLEIHEEPNKALSDADQTLGFEETEVLLKKMNQVLEVRKELSLT